MVSKRIPSVRRLELLHESFGATALAPFGEVDKSNASVVVGFVFRKRDYTLVSWMGGIWGQRKWVSVEISVEDFCDRIYYESVAVKVEDFACEVREELPDENAGINCV